MNDQLKTPGAMALVELDVLRRVTLGDASMGASATQLLDAWQAMGEIRTILAAPTDHIEDARVAELEAQQGEPVAWDVLSSNGSWCKTVRGRETAETAKARGFRIEPLYRVQPPAKVVLPEPDERRTHPGEEEARQLGWNDCRDAVGKLNPLAELKAPALSARVCGYTPGQNMVELRLDKPGALPQWLELGEPVTVSAVQNEGGEA